MTTEGIEKLGKHLTQLGEEPQSSIKGHLLTVQAKECNRIKCEFHLITCEDEEVREADFIDYLVASIIRYVHKRKKYKSKLMFTNPNYAGKIFLEARDKFIENSRVDSGEIGELILFVLLESQGIFQVVNKMLLKTSQQMHVHGADVIHVQVENAKLVLHFGESKMHADLSNAIDDFVDSIEKFIDPKTGRQRFELNVVSTHIDESKFGEHTDMIIDLIDPFSENKESLRKVNSGLIGYDWDVLSNYRGQYPGTDLISYLKNEYSKTYDTVVQTVKQAISDSTVADHSFQIHFIPFRNVAEFRESFRRRL
jgi:hypothetical protein